MKVENYRRADVKFLIPKENLDHEGVHHPGRLKKPRPRIPGTGPHKPKPPKTHFKKEPDAVKNQKKGPGVKGKQKLKGKK
jgi:hypothetical protein